MPSPASSYSRFQIEWRFIHVAVKSDDNTVRIVDSLCEFVDGEAKRRQSIRIGVTQDRVADAGIVKHDWEAFQPVRRRVFGLIFGFLEEGPVILALSAVLQIDSDTVDRQRFDQYRSADQRPRIDAGVDPANAGELRIVTPISRGQAESLGAEFDCPAEGQAKWAVDLKLAGQQVADESFCATLEATEVDGQRNTRHDREDHNHGREGI